MNDTHAVIEEGLTKDSLVVDNWSSKLRTGVEVEVVSVNGEAAAPKEEAPQEEPSEETPAEGEEEAASKDAEKSPEEEDMTEEAK